jgi:hypothetical protein
MLDIRKGDKIEYSYTVYGTQCLAEGIVSEVKEDGSCVIDQGRRILVVDHTSVLKRFPRAEELVKPEAPAPKTEEEQFNEKYKGISIYKKGDEFETEETVEEKVEDTEEDKPEVKKSNKRFSFLGDNND